MASLLLLSVCALFFIAAYFTYGRWLGRRVFGLDPERERDLPALVKRRGAAESKICPESEIVFLSCFGPRAAGRSQ